MSKKDKPYRFGLLFGALAVFLSACVANDFCGSSDQRKYVTGVSVLEIIDANKIRVTKQTGAPVYFIDAEGNAIKSNILGLSDKIVLRDEHFGAEFKVIDITQETVSFAVQEGWSYPVSGWCTPGESSGTIILKPYNTHNKLIEVAPKEDKKWYVGFYPGGKEIVFNDQNKACACYIKKYMEALSELR